MSPSDKEGWTVIDLPKHMYRLGKVLEKEHHALAERKDDGHEAIDQFARLGDYLLETGVNVLSEVPELDTRNLEDAALAVRSVLADRLREPPSRAYEIRRKARTWRLGGITVSVFAERRVPAVSEGQS
jgi:hypothetical protein